MTLQQNVQWATAAGTITLSFTILIGQWLTADDLPKRATSELEPAAWGSDHVGERHPEYVTGEECLFCHRKEIGTTWSQNRHTLTVRPITTQEPGVRALKELFPEQAATASYVMGHKRVTRFLKRGAGYGKLDLLTASFARQQKKLQETAAWDPQVFGDRCAGCHTTAVDTKPAAFSALALDCYVCHGAVDLRHTKQPKMVLLSQENRTPREVISICGQCHLRGGISKTTKRPYPNTFVPGDNLFRDFHVDLSVDALKRLQPSERHIFENVRHVAVNGQEETCLACHDLHRMKTEKHQELEFQASCTTCHTSATDYGLVEAYERSRGLSSHHPTCDY